MAEETRAEETRIGEALKPSGPENLHRRKVMEGIVVSDRMQKTITVEVERLEMHRKYKKYIRCLTRLKAHDEKREAKVGDLVRICATRPLASTKNWRLLEIIRKAD